MDKVTKAMFGPKSLLDHVVYEYLEYWKYQNLEDKANYVAMIDFILATSNYKQVNLPVSNLDKD